VKTPRQVSDESGLDITDAAAMLGERHFWMVNHLYVAARELGFALEEAHELDLQLPPSLNVAFLDLRDRLAQFDIDLDSDD
jgi:hypothetical protein